MSRSDVSELRIDDEVMLLSLWRKEQRKTAPAKALPRLENLLKEAQVIWSETWGPPRHRTAWAAMRRGQARLPTSRRGSRVCGLQRVRVGRISDESKGYVFFLVSMGPTVINYHIHCYLELRV